MSLNWTLVICPKIEPVWNSDVYCIWNQIGFQLAKIGSPPSKDCLLICPQNHPTKPVSFKLAILYRPIISRRYNVQDSNKTLRFDSRWLTWFQSNQRASSIRVTGPYHSCFCRLTWPREQNFWFQLIFWLVNVETKIRHSKPKLALFFVRNLKNKMTSFKIKMPQLLESDQNV